MNTPTTEIKKKLKKEAVDAFVVLTFPYIYRNSRASLDAYIADLQREIKEFEDFLRDHRSQDFVRMNVEIKYVWKCPVCGWEFDSDVPVPDCCDYWV